MKVVIISEQKSLIPNMDKIIFIFKTIFRDLNRRFFNSFLPTPTFYVVAEQSKLSDYDDSIIIHNGTEREYEFSVSVDLLSQPIEILCSEFLHTMCHMHNDIKGVKDTSRQGYYHNKKFRNLARKCGLKVSQTKIYGWAATEPNSELLEWCRDNKELKDFKIYRLIHYSKNIVDKKISASPDTPLKTKNRSIKYVCPVCGFIIRSNKVAKVICAECMEMFIKDQR